MWNLLQNTAKLHNGISVEKIRKRYYKLGIDTEKQLPRSEDL